MSGVVLDSCVPLLVLAAVLSESCPCGMSVSMDGVRESHAERGYALDFFN